MKEISKKKGQGERKREIMHNNEQSGVICATASSAEVVSILYGRKETPSDSCRK
jgi:hypothetical protein